ncbi:unnamed protein product [Mytilus coruscus]|uniref:Uncharacterized protein n=1 Tax=Mytilus coruscus TaxID=42192 RepID=A0A6J8BKJ8_MYTCO|nr:unnamed protein product [Mytilus coruscus]
MCSNQIGKTVELKKKRKSSCVDLCNIKICLTWTVHKDHLDLTCKVNVLVYDVEFYNNKNTEQGYCLHPLPSPKCIPKYNNTIIRQNATTNVTYLKVINQIDSTFNGLWECRHGTNRDQASVNITVLQSDTTEARLNVLKCGTIGVLLILLFILFMIPVGIGFQNDNICRGDEFYLILGSLSGVMCGILTTRLKGVKNSEEDDNETGLSSINEDENHEEDDNEQGLSRMNEDENHGLYAFQNW